MITNIATCEECETVITVDNDPGEYLVTPGGAHERVCRACFQALKWDFSND